MNYITFYSTVNKILSDYTQGSMSQSVALDTIDRLNDKGKELGLSVSLNIILLSTTNDRCDDNLRDSIITPINIDDIDDYTDNSDYNTCMDCGVDIDNEEDYCSSCQQERDDQEEADRLEGLQEEENNRIITTRRS